VLGRACELEDGGQLVLMPWLPRLRHHPYALCGWQRDGTHVRLIARADLPAGTEVSVAYRRAVPPTDGAEAAVRLGFVEWQLDGPTAY
jgi:hypothetical protein